MPMSNGQLPKDCQLKLKVVMKVETAGLNSNWSQVVFLID